MLFNLPYNSQEITDIITKVPIGKVIKDIPIPTDTYHGILGRRAVGGPRDTLERMSFGDAIKLNTKMYHRFTSATAYADGWALCRRRLPGDNWIIWKIEKKGHLGPRLKELKEQGRYPFILPIANGGSSY